MTEYGLSPLDRFLVILIFRHQNNIPWRSCLRYHYPKGSGKVHVHVSWAQPHVHDKDEKEGDDSVRYGNLRENGCKNMVKHTMLHSYSGKMDRFHQIRKRYRAKVKVLEKPRLSSIFSHIK